MIRTEARGQTGTVVFDGEFVTITRSGLSRLTTGRPTKRIAIADISSVEVRPAGPVVSGYIRFLFPGVGPSAAGAANDENAVVFTKRQAPSFEDLRAAVEEAIGRRPVPSHDGSVADELTKLARLIELELLTREEFEAAKAKLLGA
jgi:hypothetical protein